MRLALDPTAARHLLATLLSGGLALACCGDDDGGTTIPADGAVPPPPPGAPAMCIPAMYGGGGSFRGSISGLYTASLDWGSDTRCGGNAPPGGTSFQMAFAREDLEGTESLTFTFTVVAAEGATGTGFSTGVTIGGSVFVATGGGVATIPDGGCTVDLDEHAMLSSTAVGRAYRVRGSGRCTMPADPIVGDGELVLGDFEFTGITVWPAGP